MYVMCHWGEYYLLVHMHQGFIQDFGLGVICANMNVITAIGIR